MVAQYQVGVRMDRNEKKLRGQVALVSGPDKASVVYQEARSELRSINSNAIFVKGLFASDSMLCQ